MHMPSKNGKLFLRKKPQVLYFQQRFDGFFHGSLWFEET
jgi:hypothetical protein